MTTRKRQDTKRGLGSVGPGEQRVDVAAPRARGVSCLTPAVRPSGARRFPVDGEKPLWGTELETRRMAGCLDEVGAATAALAHGQSQSVTPRCIASASDLRSARIDPRDAFLLSLIDGQLSLQSLVDASGMREDHVIAILDRLSESLIVTVS